VCLLCVLCACVYTVCVCVFTLCFVCVCVYCVCVYCVCMCLLCVMCACVCVFTVCYVCVFTVYCVCVCVCVCDISYYHKTCISSMFGNNTSYSNVQAATQTVELSGPATFNFLQLLTDNLFSTTINSYSMTNRFVDTEPTCLY